LHHRFSARAGAACGIAAALLAAPGMAAPGFQPRVGARAWSTPRGVLARVTINDQPVATLRTSAAGQGPVQRALNVKQRLSGMVAAGLTPAQIGLAPAGKQGWEIRGQGGPLLLVTPREAAAQRQTPRRLALAWARAIKARLAEPALMLSLARVLVPYGTTKTISVGGAARAEDVSLAGGNARVSLMAFDAARHRIVLRGVGAGESVVTVRADGASATLAVSVRRYAASVWPRVTVRVTGRPDAPAALVQTALFQGLEHALAATEGAQVRLLQSPRPVGALRPGASVSRRLSLRVAGPDLLPVEATPVVTVVNQPLAPASAGAIFYSNNPEQVRGRRTLFSSPLSLRRAVRLDYHHQNSNGGPLVFHVDLVNASDQSVGVHVMSGIAQPALDTVQVGRRAGAAFLRALDSGTGLVLVVPPHARVPLLVQRFAPGLTVSGLVQVQQLSGPDRALSLVVVADDDRKTLLASPVHFAQAIEDTDRADARLVSAPAAPLALSRARAASPFVFGPPRVALAGAYAAGGPWAYLRLGHGESLRNAAGTQRLWGNYGVSYFVTLRLTNPTRGMRVVGVFFAPEAGLAAGVFQVSGSPILEFDPMPPPDEKELTRVHLAPGQTRTVRLRTILLNGSAYPASLVVHAL